MLFPGAISETTPWAWSEDFFQEKLSSQPFVERLKRHMCLLETCIQEKSPLNLLFDLDKKKVCDEQ